MPKIQKPMLAGSFDPEKAKFPYTATPKIDGIRFLMVDGIAVSRTFKPIRNTYIQSLLSAHLPDGVDGELTSGDTFQSSTSAVMKITGEPDFKVWIFDWVDPTTDEIDPFCKRIANIPSITAPFSLEILSGVVMESMDDLAEYEKTCLEEGYEGVMVRDPNGTYKFGRSTVRENTLLKLKQFVDDEAELVDVEEKTSNQNPEEKDAFGYVKRSTSMGGLVPMGTTGTLVVKDKEGRMLRIGSGLNDELRQDLWDNRSKYLGSLVKYKYFPQGVKDLPRHPVFLGFRHLDDL